MPGADGRGLVRPLYRQAPRLPGLPALVELEPDQRLPPSPVQPRLGPGTERPHESISRAEPSLCLQDRPAKES